MANTPKITSTDNVTKVHFAYDTEKRRPKLKKHNRIVAILKLAMPSIAAGAIALMLLWPQIIAQKEKFALGIGSPIITGKTDTLSIVNSRYYSVDSKNRPFKITAKLAEETEPGSRVIALTEPKASILLESGSWLTMESREGKIYQKDNRAVFKDFVRAFTDDGYDLKTSEITVDLTSHTLESRTATTGIFPEGTITSEGLKTMNKNDIIKFTGHTKLILIPNKNKR